jgi:glucuronyl/N-acetylglucosaminyl transferase EXT2
MKIYIYPIKNYVLKQDSKVMILNDFGEQYYQMLESIIDSSFYVNNADRACLFITPIDTLNELT